VPVSSEDATQPSPSEFVSGGVTTHRSASYFASGELSAPPPPGLVESAPPAGNPMSVFISDATVCRLIPTSTTHRPAPDATAQPQVAHSYMGCHVLVAGMLMAQIGRPRSIDADGATRSAARRLHARHASGRPDSRRRRTVRV
jgi:hypothetical protein